MTRVGAGPLKGELSKDEVVKRGWMEYGTVTGRERRAAPFDVELAKRAVNLNGATQVALTKMDVVYPSCRGATSYESLTEDVVGFVEQIESVTGTSVTLVGTGPGAEDIIDRR